MRMKNRPTIRSLRSWIYPSGSGSIRLQSFSIEPFSRPVSSFLCKLLLRMKLAGCSSPSRSNKLFPILLRCQEKTNTKVHLSLPFPRKGEREGIEDKTNSPSRLFFLDVAGGCAVQLDFHLLLQVLVVLHKDLCHFGSREFHGQLAALRQGLSNHGP